MDTPICDFVRDYALKAPLRLHMPGHKGKAFLGPEGLDITEVSGADSLYEADGIICRSEENASRLFGCPTFYSAEGSSQCIRAMLYLAMLQAKEEGRRPLIAAARNVHKAFLSAVALLGLDVVWLYPEEEGSYLSCQVTVDALEGLLRAERPAAVYLTSPDYLGNMADIGVLSQVCRRHGALLLVDNAHGAYLRFLEPSLHPMDLGADMCCDSAHKTLPVLTGGAYLHITPGPGVERAKAALALFGSTSPSYLILQSLDLANVYLASFPPRLRALLEGLEALKERLREAGFVLLGREPMKLTLAARAYGYPGTELAELLRHGGIECEFADPDVLVLMVTPENTEEDLARLRAALLAIPRKAPVSQPAVMPGRGAEAMSVRGAMLSPWEEIPVEKSEGRILASPSVGCPPAVPIAVCGQRIGKKTIECFRYYGIESVAVVK